MYTISKVLGIFDKSKDGQQYRTKKGDLYRKANVNFNNDERIISIFVWNNETCEVGDEYEGTIESREWERKTYYSFNGKKKEDKYMKEINELKFSLAHAHELIKNIVDHLKREPWKLSPQYNHSPAAQVLPEVKAAQVEQTSADDINPQDIPF